MITHLVLPFGTGAADREVFSRQPAPEVADDEEQDERVEQAISQPDAGDIGKEEKERKRGDQREARESHGISLVSSPPDGRIATQRSAAAPARYPGSGSAP